MLEVLQVGRVVGGHFRLRNRFGEGDSGRLWAAEDVRAPGVGVVIEFMCDVAASESARARFEREGRAWLTFHCPQVARVIDRGVDAEAGAFRVLEQPRGETLECVLEREPALSFAEVAVIVEQLCHAIARLEASQLPVPVLDAACVFVAPGVTGTRGIKLLALNALGQSRSPVPEFARLVQRMLAGDALPRAGLDEWLRAASHDDAAQRFSSIEQAGLAFAHLARGRLAGERRRSPVAIAAQAKPGHSAAANAKTASAGAFVAPPRTDDPASHVVMIDPGVLGSRAVRKRAGLALSALVAIALGVVGGFVLRTSWQHGAQLGHRGGEPAREHGTQHDSPEGLMPIVGARDAARHEALADARDVRAGRSAGAQRADRPGEKVREERELRIEPAEAQVRGDEPSMALQELRAEPSTVESAAEHTTHVWSAARALSSVMPAQAAGARAHGLATLEAPVPALAGAALPRMSQAAASQPPSPVVRARPVDTLREQNVASGFGAAARSAAASHVPEVAAQGASSPALAGGARTSSVPRVYRGF